MRKLRRAAGAFLLSFWIPGLGQVFDSQLLLGSVFFLAYLLIVGSAGLFHLLVSFRVGGVYVVVLWTLELSAAIVAAKTAVHQVNSNSVQRLRWPAYALGAVFILIAVFPLISSRSIENIFGVRAFKIPSDSMSPTILNGDRIIADMRYFRKHHPERGDLVIYLMPKLNVLYVKRVIAVGGDTIAIDSQGTILNGEHIVEPYVYREGHADENAANFGPATVPPGQLFLMGDNRNNSYDSRYTGSVGVDHVLGKPVYIYYSSGRFDRIGRAIQ